MNCSIERLLIAGIMALSVGVGIISGQGVPPPPGGKVVPITQTSLTPEQKAKRIDTTCPIKGKFSVRYKAVGGAVIDKDVSFDKGGEARYCRYISDLAYCNQNNPTPEIPCKYIDAILSPSECPLMSSKSIPMSKDKSFGPWTISKNTNILFNVYVCDRAWKIDSCRYWNQETAVTIFKNQGLFSIDRNLGVKFSVCEIDQDAENEFQARLSKGKDAMIGLLQIKRKIWDGKCPAANKQCLAKVTEIAIKAQLEATKLIATNYDADAIKTMKHISSIYDPMVESATKTFK